MNVVDMKLSDLKKAERNVRVHSDEQIRELKRSLKQFGQTRAIVVDEGNNILIGNGLYQAMIEEGYKKASVYVVKGLSENEKKKLMIADNKTYALGIDNLDVLDSFLAELGDDLDVPGFDEEILREMVADADTITEKISKYGTLDQDEIQSIQQTAAKREQEEEQEKSVEEGTGGGTANVQQYVICPKCGEKIWL